MKKLTLDESSDLIDYLNQIREITVHIDNLDKTQKTTFAYAKRICNEAYIDIPYDQIGNGVFIEIPSEIIIAHLMKELKKLNKELKRFDLEVSPHEIIQDEK